MAILNTSTSDTAARLVGVQGQPQDAGFKLTQVWPWISGRGASTDTDVKSLVTGLNATTTATNPKANNDSYAGTFVVSSVEAKDENVDGTGDRACSIVRVLTKVKSGSDVAGCGTPDIGSDKATLNFLGFQEGEQEHVYYIYRNLNPANRATTMGLSPTLAGYTIVKRKYEIETDKTGTFTVVFEKDTWPISGQLTWAGNKIKVTVINYDARSNTGLGNAGGSGYQEEQQLTGLSETGYVPVLVKAKRGDTNRVVTDVTVIERGDGEYQIKQRQAISFASTSDTAALIEDIGGEFAGTKLPTLRRTWPRRTLAAKNTLTTSTGKAINNYVYGSDTYIHNQVHIRDNRDGTFDVTQELGFVEGGGGATQETFFNDSNIEFKYYIRSKDNYVKKRKFFHLRRGVVSEHAGWNWIKSKDTGVPIVAGSARVLPRKHFYMAELLKSGNDTKFITAWGAP